jgi:hypothetical protein
MRRLLSPAVTLWLSVSRPRTFRGNNVRPPRYLGNKLKPAVTCGVDWASEKRKERRRERGSRIACMGVLMFSWGDDRKIRETRERFTRRSERR